jgi:hypothetical protein
MPPAGRTGFVLVASAVGVAVFGASAQAQQNRYPKPTELPNPYRLVEDWPTLPKSMNGRSLGRGHQGARQQRRQHLGLSSLFQHGTPGHATCIGRGDSNPPILEFDPSGMLLKSFGVGLFAYPHGFTIDGDGNLWVSDVNDEATVLGVSAKNADGVVRGQEVLKLSPAGKMLMMIGKEGVSGNGPDTFDRPTGVAVAPNGDVFVTDGHMPNEHNSARVVKFSKDGRFIKTWGHKGAAPGDFDEPHDIFVGGSEGHVYIADRRNNRIQVFDQDGNFIAAWKQFGQPSSVFVGKDDSIYVGASFPEPAAKKGELRGIVVGNAKDGSLKAFIPDPADADKLDVGTTASGIAADDAGTIYAADVAAHNLRKYVKVK